MSTIGGETLWRCHSGIVSLGSQSCSLVIFKPDGLNPCAIKCHKTSDEIELSDIKRAFVQDIQDNHAYFHLKAPLRSFKSW